MRSIFRHQPSSRLSSFNLVRKEVTSQSVNIADDFFEPAPAPEIVLLAGVSNGRASVLGLVKPLISIRGLSGGIASVSGFVKPLRRILGVSSGIASVLGVVKPLRGIAGISNGVASTLGTVKVLRNLTAISSGVATVSGVAKLLRSISGLVIGMASVSGTSSILKRLGGVSSGMAFVSGSSKIDRGLSGVSNGITLLIGILDFPIIPDNIERFGVSDRVVSLTILIPALPKFPTILKPTFPVTMIPFFEVGNILYVGGREQRIAGVDEVRYKIRLRYKYLDELDKNTVLAFFIARKGEKETFYWVDPTSVPIERAYIVRFEDDILDQEYFTHRLFNYNEISFVETFWRAA